MSAHDDPFRRYWHPVAASADLGSAPLAATLLDERLVLFRDGSGVAAFKDLCIHRGAALSLGRVAEGRLVCPYHGWAYERGGACVHIPSLLPGTAIPKRARVEAYPCREAYGLIWVALAEAPAPFPAWPDDAWARPDYRVFLVGRYSWAASAARIVENALDFSHFNFVHQGYTELANGAVIKPHEVTTSAGGLELAYEDGRLRRAYTLEFPFTVHDRKQVIAGARGGTWSEGVDPRPGDVTILSFIAAPLAAARSSIYVFVGRNHSLDRADADFAQGFDTIMEQDRVIVESQRPEALPLDLAEELHVRYADLAAVAYRRLLRERGAAAP